jgi:hypothetical protein
MKLGRLVHYPTLAVVGCNLHVAYSEAGAYTRSHFSSTSALLSTV